MSFITKLSLKNRWITFFITALLSIASIMALVNLKMELMPDIEMPVTSVITVYPGASPEQVAENVTKPVEQAVAQAGEYKEINATSSANLSMLIITYEYGVDMDEVTDNLTRNLAGVSLPDGAQSPQLYPISMDAMPVVMLSLAGELPGPELRGIAAAEISPRLSSIDGVFSVDITGGEEQVVLTPDIESMNDSGISAAQLAAVLGSGQYNSLEELRAAVLGPGLTLGDISTVKLGATPGTTVTTTNGEPSIGIMITKEPGANTVEVANAVMAEVESIAAGLSSDLSVSPIFDQSEFIEQSISDLYREAIVGAILAVLAIFVFLRVFRASLITAISIPLSVLAGFLLMYAAGITINLLTLSAMALAVGRVVDDSIVVLEVIFRHLENGENFKEAAIKGAREVAAPITSATIATVVVFIPLVFVGGMVGEMFMPFALTVTFALMASLVIALTAIPALTSFISPREVQKEAEIETKGSWYQRAYKPSLAWALRHRALTMVTVTLLVIGSFSLVPVIGTTFLPSASEKMLLVELEMPLGADIDETVAKASQIEELIDAGLDWETYQTSVGASGMMGGMGAMGSGSGTATITVVLDSEADLAAEADKLRLMTEPLAGDAEITVSSGMEGMAQGGGLGSESFKMTVSGNDIESVDQAALQITEMLSGIDGLINIESDTTQVIPQPQISPDPAALVEYGINPETISGELAMLTRGAPIAEVSVNNHAYSVFIAPLLPLAENQTQIQQIRIGVGDTITLGEIAEVSFVPRPTELLRVNQQPASTIQATINVKNVGAVNTEIITRLDTMNLPAGVEVSIGGVYEQMTEGFNQMFIAIGAAILIAYLVLVVTFRSFRNPFIIMFSLPVASIGALFGLLVTGNPLGISAMMGFLMLVGIVLTNAIVLITLIDHLRRSGMSPVEAIMEGGHIRLRPILMTSISTALAMLPLALGFGEGSIIAGELAIVVIGGLISSTILTLYVVPVMYSLLNRVAVKTE